MKELIQKLWLLVLVAVPSIGMSQSAKVLTTAQLKSGKVEFLPNVSLWVDSMSGSDAFARPVQVLLHFETVPDKAQKEALAQNGITLLEYLPVNTYSAIIRKTPAKAKLQPIPINGIVSMLPEWKAEKYLWNKAEIEKGSLKVLVSLCETADMIAFSGLVASLGGSIEQGNMADHGYYRVTVPATKLKSLAGWYGVRFISPHFDEVPLDKQSIPAVKGGNAIASPSWGGYGLNGDSVAIGVGDNTSGIFHTDVTDRILNFNPAQVTNHGVHINCIAGGAAILDPLAASMTPKVSLINFFFSTVLSATGAMYQEHNMTITNNSYTIVENDCDYFGTYDLYSSFMDTLSLQYPLVQHVFAAGNDGELTCPPHAPGYATVGGGYQPSKNTLVVGSVAHNFEQAWDQSRGPVKDGRIKPEIVAVGASVYSGLWNNNYGWAGGTSMAAPQACSGLAILTQRYKQLHAGTQPRADLLRAILVNGAMDLGNVGPDYSYGFGMMDVGRSLKILDNNQFATGDLNTGDSQLINISVPAGTGQLKVMLLWNDVPASPVAATQLVNDLDMSVTTPGGTPHLPLVLNGAPANARDLAVEQADHLNNIEQVTIANPAAGNYTMKVRGFNVPEGPQHFVVAYDILPKSVELTFPLGGEQFSNIDTIRVFWNAVPDGSTYSVDLSLDEGANWIPVSNSVPAWAKYCGFMPTGVNSGKCMVRVKRNGTSEVVTSQKFAITSQPVLARAASQCPGYLNVHWSPVPNATAYQLLKKVGPQMVLVATVTDTNYSFRGLSTTTSTVVAVQPVINGLQGYRSLALVATANTGDCLNPVSDGDLMVAQIVGPQSGRMYTSSALGTTATLAVQIRNLYTANCSNYVLSWSVNNGAWQTLVSPGTVMPANGTAVINVLGVPFSAPGDYSIRVAIQNLATTDPQQANDSLTYVVKIIPNDPIDLSFPFTDDFETMGKFTAHHDSMGVAPNGHWDYFNDDDSGRLRSYIYNDVVISGNRSVSMDQVKPMRQGSRNVFAGTFNLATYDTALDEIRVDFDYVLHGNPTNPLGNIVNVRASDDVTWQQFFKYDLTSFPGYIKSARSISLTDAVRSAGLNFSTSTQLAFAQNDTSIIAGRNYGTGITIDNFKLYTVANDGMLSSIVSPQPNNCGLPSSVPLTVWVRNGVNYTIKNVRLQYKLDGGTIHSALIDSIKAKDSVLYTFSEELALGTAADHSIDVWLSNSGDTYLYNDSILNYQFRNSKIITSFPYLEDFEKGNGGFYDGGYLSSWQYGTPAATKINTAASGSKAWKSSLTGRYNNLEVSYLYSPCYDISQLSDPMLSFSMAEDIENCGGILCDGAYVEYSFDGLDWNRLGAAGQGYNWYDSTFHLWNAAGFDRWHVASIRLPQPPTGKVLHLRFVIFADPAVSLEGVAIDDIHIFDKKEGIFTAVDKTEVESVTTGGQTNSFIAMNALLAAVQPTSSTGATSVTLYRHDTVSNPSQTQFSLPRSYTIQSAIEPGDNVLVKLFIEDAEIVKTLADTACPSCTRLRDAYSLGITQYSNKNNRSAENGSLADDTGGKFVYIPSSSVKWVPFDNGYRAEFVTSTFGEFWFNNGGPTAAFSAGEDYLNFLAFREGDNARIIWHSLIDTAVSQYVLERSYDGLQFSSIKTVASLSANPGDYSFPDSVDVTANPDIYYRLSWSMKGGDAIHYSPVRRLSGDSDATVIFRASMVSSSRVAVTWQSFIDGIVDHYILERAIGQGGYAQLGVVSAARRYGQQYYQEDIPMNIGGGTALHYRLTAVLPDGTKIELPERTIYWIEGSAITNVYPNPVRDGKIYIRWSADPGTKMHVALSDITGRLIEETNFESSDWDNTSVFQTRNYPAGVYMLTTTIGKSRNTAKVVFN